MSASPCTKQFPLVHYHNLDFHRGFNRSPNLRDNGLSWKRHQQPFGTRDCHKPGRQRLEMRKEVGLYLFWPNTPLISSPFFLFNMCSMKKKAFFTERVE